MLELFKNSTPINYRFIILVSIPAKVATEYRHKPKNEIELAETLLSFSDEFVRENNIVVIDVDKKIETSYNRR